MAYDLDATDWILLRELQANARITRNELGQKAGLSGPAAGERIRRLEDAGVITGYHAAIDLSKVGRTISAFIRVRFSGGKYDAFERLVEQTPQILECHHVTGDDCFIIRAAVATMSELEDVSALLSRFGPTATSIVYSSALERRIIEAAG